MSTTRRGDRGLGRTAAGGNEGSYAAHTRAAAAPPNAERDWGEVTVGLGSRTQWGEVDSIEHVAPGIVFAGTPSHGGYKVSPERNREIPAPFRSRNGWYEEDCEWRAIAHTFPEAFAGPEQTVDEVRDSAAESLKYWSPDQWEQMTGEKVTAAESRTVAEREWDAAHAHAPKFSGAQTAATTGYTRVIGEVDGERREYLVPKDEYDAAFDRAVHRFAIDPDRHPVIAPRPPEPKYENPRNRVINLEDRVRADFPIFGKSRLSAAKQAAIEKDLGQRWRDPETGGVRPLSSIIQADGMSHRGVIYDERGRASYYLGNESSHAFKVSKATFDWLEHELPDTTGEAQHAYAAYKRADHRASQLEAETYGYQGLSEARAARQKATALAERAQQVRREENARKDAQFGTHEEIAERQRQQDLEREAAAIREHEARATRHATIRTEEAHS